MDFEARDEIADRLTEIYKNYDHYRLMKSNSFIEFVKERILYLIDHAKFESAVMRIRNILGAINSKANLFWHN